MQIQVWWRFVGMMILMLVLMVTGCTAAATDDAPVRLVQSVVAAWESGDAAAILSAIEPAPWRREIAPEVRQYTGLMRQLTFVDPQYTLLDNNGTIAHVRLESTLVYALQDGRSGEQPLHLIVETVQDDGVWYIRKIELANLSDY